MKHLLFSVLVVGVLLLTASCTPSLFNASLHGDVGKVSELLAEGKDVNVKALGFTPLMAAAEEGHVQVVELLLDKGAAINTLVRGGSTALGYAAGFGQDSIVNLLVSKGADINITLASLHSSSGQWAMNGVRVLNSFISRKREADSTGSIGKGFDQEAVITENPKAKAINIAVMDLNTTSGLTQPEILLLTDKLVNSLVQAGFTVIERSKRDEILKEQGFQLSGACSESSCLVEAGQLLGVQKMVGGTIGKFGAANIIELRVIDIASGKIDNTYSKELQGDISNLPHCMVEAAETFSKSIK